ncbi:hypothetical protein AHF37_04816 [Paragonimus kellicotti]|nr:hypothetical protein AHF37_04816 [Paragonimus kellicotti]
MDALIQPALSLSQSDRQTHRSVQSSFTPMSPKHRAPNVPTQLSCQLSDQKPMSPSQPAQLFSQPSHSAEPLLINQNATSKSSNGPRPSEVGLLTDSNIRPSNLTTSPLNEHHHPRAPAVPFPKAVPPSPTSPTASKTTSAIPRLTSSGIPRLVTPRLSAASQVPEQTNSNNSTRLCGSISATHARPYDQSFRTNPMSLPQTPIPPLYTGQTGPFSPPACSPVEPLDLVDNGHHSAAPYSDRSRLVSRPINGGRLDRAVSERPPRMIGSKINSLKNVSHKPGGGNIFKETLPWLKYNKPNLPPEEKARINKQRPASHGEMSTSSSTGHTSTSNS